MAKLSRLSPYNIESPLIRAELYKEIRKGEDGWESYVVSPDEILRPELISYRKYRTDELKWVVLVVTGLDDYREALVSGESIDLPPVAWVRRRIRHWQQQEERLKR